MTLAMEKIKQMMQFLNKKKRIFQNNEKKILQTNARRMSEGIPATRCERGKKIFEQNIGTERSEQKKKPNG